MKRFEKTQLKPLKNDVTSMGFSSYTFAKFCNRGRRERERERGNIFITFALSTMPLTSFYNFASLSSFSKLQKKACLFLFKLWHNVFLKEAI